MRAAPQQPHSPPDGGTSGAALNKTALKEQGRSTAFGQGGSFLAQEWKVRPRPWMWTPAQLKLLHHPWLCRGPAHSQNKLLFPEEAAEAFEAVHLTLVLAVTVIWLLLSTSKGCENFSLQPLRLLGWVTAKGLWKFTGQLPPACSPRIRDTSTAVRWLFSPGELCSLLSISAAQTMSLGGGRRTDLPSSQQLDWELDPCSSLRHCQFPFPAAEEGEGEWGSSAFKDNLHADFLQWFSNKLGYIAWVDSRQPQHNRKGTTFPCSSPHKGCMSWKPVE